MITDFEGQNVKHIELGELTPLRRLYHDSRTKRIVQAICADCDEKNRESVSILDIGSGRGELLRLLRDKGFKKLYACDENAECVKRSSDIANAKHGDVKDIDILYANQSFDYVILAGVLEHVVDPISLLKKIKSMARHGAIIAIPNMNYLGTTMLTYIKGPIKINEGHLYGWDASTFFNLLTRHIGFKSITWIPDTVLLPGKWLRNILSILKLDYWLQFEFLPKRSPFLGALLIAFCKIDPLEQKNETH